MTVSELKRILNSYEARGAGDREVVLLRKRTKSQWYAESLDACLDGNDAELFSCPKEFTGKVVLE